MKHYFGFVGVMLIIGWIGGLIWYLVFLIGSVFGKAGILATILYLVGFLGIAVLGIAPGLLFLSHADMLPESQNAESKYAALSKNYSVGTKVELIEDFNGIPAKTVGTVSSVIGEYVAVDIDGQILAISPDRLRIIS